MIQTQKNGGIGLLWLLLLFGVVLVVTVNPKTVCDKPLVYSVGVVDNEFGITAEEFKNVLIDAEVIWEEGIGMDLFTYNKDAEFKINLIFDERQRETIAEKRLRESLGKSNDAYDELVKRYNSLESLYDNFFDKYKNKIELYEERLFIYNEKVEYYNSIGGASRKKYNELEKEKMNLQADLLQLEQEKKKLNSMGNEANLLVEKINSFANTLNSEVSNYNEAFGTVKIFDQGEYNGREINVYQFDEVGDLRVVLTHEFGHALNLDHVENPFSIMYYLMEKQDLNNPKLSDEDINALNTECNL